MAFQFTRRSRAQNVLDRIDAADRDLTRDDRARKYRKMAASPYRFFRGTNHLYWGDVWHDWRYYLFGGVLETQTWLQGDAHVHNHGAYGNDRAHLHYGMDDFDDAVIADYQYDLWRHATSMVLDARENVGLSDGKIRRSIRHLLSSYLDTLATHRDGTRADQIHVDYSQKPLGPFMAKLAGASGKPGKTGNGRANQLRKWTVFDNGDRRLDAEKTKLGSLSPIEQTDLAAALQEDYLATLAPEGESVFRKHFIIKDMARRLNAGTGSLGLQRYYVLIAGEAEDQSDDLILDVKEQTPPEAYRFMNAAERRAWRKMFRSEGERHAQAFKALANHDDEYLGWLTLGQRSFSVRQRSPFKTGFPTHKVAGFKQYRNLTRQWGAILAREHIRGARSLRPEEPGFFCEAVLRHCDGKRELFKDSVTTMAFTYAQCVTQDHALFVEERC